MKEVFTKGFWKGVKKTFDEAREGAPSEDNAAPSPGASSTPELPATGSAEPPSKKLTMDI
jgi:hypothetical protein